MLRLTIEQRRGFAVEGEHPVDACLSDGHGLVVQVGEDRLTTFRSAAKPFQLETSLALLTPAQRVMLTSRDLALGAASHHGEPFHVAQVRDLLSRLGRTPEHLYCGVHAPSDQASARALFASGAEPSVLHNNCSGKHSFMAAACAAHGFAQDYRGPEHPLQQQVLETLQARTDGAVAGSVVDGCGIPCFVLPLSAMALAWARVAHAMRDDPEPHGLGAIGRAMLEHPRLMSGTHAFDGFLAEQTGVVAKVGAQGLLCVALPKQGLGLALRARSGSDAVRPQAALSLLERFVPEALPAAVPSEYTGVFNLVGQHVGDIVARWLD
ncbi:MAG: asparaginase [Myxococcales bacterium]